MRGVGGLGVQGDMGGSCLGPVQGLLAWLEPPPADGWAGLASVLTPGIPLPRGIRYQGNC